mmetsp:Transcript_6732/g.19032  ORF Transcript_6732/g.19032 Transcript_6732/m.19032 type:complete len:251 (-) Transcript_6732:36-788(-)
MAQTGTTFSPEALAEMESDRSVMGRSKALCCKILLVMKIGASGTSSLMVTAKLSAAAELLFAAKTVCSAALRSISVAALARSSLPNFFRSLCFWRLLAPLVNIGMSVAAARTGNAGAVVVGVAWINGITGIRAWAVATVALLPPRIGCGLIMAGHSLQPDAGNQFPAYCMLRPPSAWPTHAAPCANPISVTSAAIASASGRKGTIVAGPVPATTTNCAPTGMSGGCASGTEPCRHMLNKLSLACCAKQDW